MKRLFFYSLFLLLPTLVLGQYRNLRVPPTPQKGTRWCWAASMEGIARFFDPGSAHSQCTIVDRYLYMIGTSYTVDSGCSGACITDPGWIPNFPTNQTVYYNETDNFDFPDYFDLLLSEMGLYSMQDFNLLQWDQYKQEIDLCRPVILVYNAVGYNAVSSINHAVVAKGYYEFPGGSYFYVYDPWEPCQGDSFLLNRNVLLGLATSPEFSTKFINRIETMVHHISPKAEDCDACGQFEEEPPLVPLDGNILISELVSSVTEFIGTNLQEDADIMDVRDYAPDSHQILEVDHLRYDYFEKNNYRLSYEEAKIPSNLLEVTYSKSDTPLEATIRCDEGGKNCVVEKIGLGNKPISQIATIPKKGRVLLSNDKNVFNPDKLPVYEYRLVRAHPTTFELFRFEVEGQAYWHPANATAQYYFYGKTDVKEGPAIVEKAGLRGLDIYFQRFPWDSNDKPSKLNKWKRILKIGYLNVRRCFGKYKYITE